MSKRSGKMSALEVGRISKAGKYSLGDHLYLQVSKQITKSWVFRFSWNCKDVWMGLGSSKTMSLAEARAKCFELQRDLAQGVNPIEKRAAIESQRALAETKRITFDECAAQFIAFHRGSWKNEKHVAQWESTLRTYASPVIGALSVKDIDTSLVMKILEPIWYKRTETADRLRGRIERVLSWATVRKYRDGENPARWRGHMDQLLPKPSSVQKVDHFKALPFIEVGAFVAKLHEHSDVGARALEFVILTATRTSETLGARWSEINLDENYWLIPAERMKAGKEHKVPLSDRALEILQEMRLLSNHEFVFPGARVRRPLSNMALLMMIRRMGYQVTTHGFRSSFSDWAAEKTNFPREVVELALAHMIQNKVEAAYRRGDLFFKRQVLMKEWSAYCATIQPEHGKVFELVRVLSPN